MKRKLLGTMTAVAMIVGVGAAAAQTVVITPENETVIREYVTTQEVEPIAPPPDVEITVGATLPDTIEVRALEVPELETRYDYVVVDNRTVLVEPQSREIVHIIE
ncbi:MAG: DUF1236 domain-containing protein [Rhizobiaceae bacterium]|nr:DUF1236 domain-containing protein [Rhizobiaceae bacterium]MCV0407168.1 DUF1236 domain-containing protein [Rhizobiaceae bacterium]